jgi:hypothetical protein
MMRLEKAALLAEVLGGVAVVLSVIYLAVQISDNNRLLRSQAHYNALEVAQGTFEALIESDTLAGVLNQCRSNPREVEADVWSRCSTYYFMQANAWEYLFYQHKDESIPPELWVGGDGYFSNEASTNPGWVRFWEDTAIGFGEPFRSYIGERVKQNSEESNVANK